MAANAIVLAAAVGGMMAGCRPTGWGATDRLSTALFAGLVALATSRARRWTWLVVGGGAALAAVAANDNAAKAMALWALLLALASIASDRRDRAIGALTGGLAIEALLRLRALGGSGATAAVTAVVVLPVLVSAYRRLPAAGRRTVKRSVAVGVAVGAVLVVPMVVGALVARPRIERGIADVNAGFDAAKRGDKPGATALFRRAEAEFSSAHTWVGSWWTRPARIVPVGGLQAHVLDVATREGDELAGAASRVADTEKDPLSIDAGAVSIDSLKALAGPLADAASTLEASSRHIDDAGSTWLLPPLASRLDRFSAEIARALPAAQDALAAVQLAPSLLGGDGPRHYFVGFTTPAEARGLGGFIGSWALLTINQGHIELTRTGRINELNDPAGPDRHLDGPARYLAAYGEDFHPGRFFQNVTASPDFHDVGSVITQLFPQTTVGTPIDGVIMIDPISLAAMLQLTGPVQVEGLDEPLTAENAAQILLFDQYGLFPNGPASQGGDDLQPGTREDFLADASRATFEAFLAGQLPGPQLLVDALGPMVDQRRLLAFSTHPDEESLFEQLGMDGAFPATVRSDFLALVTTNRGGNKLDAYLHRELTYHVTVDPPAGEMRATATVVLRNDAPAQGLPFEVGFNDDGLPVGTNQTLLTVYTPSSLDTVTLDGQPLQVSARNEFGLAAYTVAVDLPPGSASTLTFALHGRVPASASYRLRMAMQPLVNPDTVDVQVTGGGGWHVPRQGGLDVANGTATVAVDPQKTSDLQVDLDR